MASLKIDELRSDQTYSTSVSVTDEMIRNFARATGDNNPIHLDDEAAKKSIFKRRVAHGMLSAGILSGVIGMQFPGEGTIYLSQTMKFLAPVFIGDTLKVALKVMEIIKEKKRIRLETVITNQDQKIIFTGEAMVMPPA
ncbi:MAG: MaoC family dehydratase [Thermodesulfobacteriota bacterium]